MELEPLTLEYVPTPHGVQTWRILTALASAQKPPGGQAVHAVWPARAEKNPASHASQVELPFAGMDPNVPGEHCKQLALLDAPLAGMCVPDGQGEGASVPGEGQKWPRRHALQP